MARSTRRSASAWGSAYVVIPISRIHFEAGSLARRDDQKKRVRNVVGGTPPDRTIGTLIDTLVYQRALQ
jgi:hypothetical protein